MILPRLSVVAVILLVLAAAGCSGPQALKRNPTVSTEVVNASSHTVRVSLHIGERVRLEGRPVQPLKDGRAIEIRRGQSGAMRIRRPASMVLFGSRDDEELVYWLRAEIITPSWDEESVAWFELLGPPAEQITIRDATGRGATGLLADAVSVPITPLAPELYPMRDRNYAFELPSETQ